jgi:hypothetical protein
METDLIPSLPGVSPSPFPRVGQREAMKRLTVENRDRPDLRSLIADLSRQIATIDAENHIICPSLPFFQAHMIASSHSNDSS